ncbi:hypothetical protein QBC46DRAFT_70311 [Diplogelasinospora grovesii]|uniref:C2H2-type domain-containing protein n=1 Tax=Diplogelasinospora grovesii TaxID=303347 RepID=A0AAN6MX97_9PEZI|nr:hypothetical protein QBC46DRAFT_70311 [Diplogelasinospora grovesii]
MDSSEIDPNNNSTATEDVAFLRKLLRKYGPEGFDGLVEQASSDTGLSHSLPPAFLTRLDHDYSPSLPSTPTLASSATSITQSLQSSDPHLADWCSHGGNSTTRSRPWQDSSGPWNQFHALSSLSDGSYCGESQLSPACDASVEQMTDLSLQTGSREGQRGKYECPFCLEYGIVKGTTRTQDLLRHFHNFHQENSQWICKIGGGCGLSFEVRAAYERHTKEDHAGVKDPDAKVNLCQQVAFACGFESCRQVFESPTDEEGPGCGKEYFKHVLDHIKRSRTDRWSYSRRVRNLLHQTQVREQWRIFHDAFKKETGRQLAWDPQSSGLLRNLLECRHLVDVPMLCRYAVLLGSIVGAPPVHPNNFMLPLLDTCRVGCHRPQDDPRFKKTAHSFQQTTPDGVPDAFRIPKKRRALPCQPYIPTFCSGTHHLELSSPEAPPPEAPHELEPFTRHTSFQLGFAGEEYQMNSQQEALLHHSALRQTLDYFPTFDAVGQSTQAQESYIHSNNAAIGGTIQPPRKTSNRRGNLLRQSFEKFRGRAYNADMFHGAESTSDVN